MESHPFHSRTWGKGFLFINGHSPAGFWECPYTIRHMHYQKEFYKNFNLHTILHKRWDFFVMQSHESHSSSCENSYLLAFGRERNWFSYFKNGGHNKHCGERHWCLWCNLVTWKVLHRYMKFQHGEEKRSLNKIFFKLHSSCYTRHTHLAPPDNKVISKLICRFLLVLLLFLHWYSCLSTCCYPVEVSGGFCLSLTTEPTQLPELQGLSAGQPTMWCKNHAAAIHQGSNKVRRLQEWSRNSHLSSLNQYTHKYLQSYEPYQMQKNIV